VSGFHGSLECRTVWVSGRDVWVGIVIVRSGFDVVLVISVSGGMEVESYFANCWERVVGCKA